jgi:hypothetical protein
MTYKVAVSNGMVLEKCIQSVSFNVDPPPDDFYSTRTYTVKSMTITGKIGTDEKTIGLYEWALIPATNPDCYKEITVEQTRADQLVRKVKFPKAFVIDYSESFSNKEGVGYFSLFVRQFAGLDIECTNEATQQTDTTEAEPVNDLEEARETIAPQVQGAGATGVLNTVSNTGKARMSFTDRLAKTKEMQDNNIVSQPNKENIVEAPKVEAKFTLNGKEYKDVNPTARNPRPNPGEPISGLSAVNNNTRKAHAEIGAMHQALTEGNKGGIAVLEVKGQRVCDFCHSDVKKMSQKLELNELHVTDETGTYKFMGSDDFKNVADGGKRWEDAKI